jgi:gliding motility-associated-like protein
VYIQGFDDGTCDAPIFELGSDSTLCGGSFRDVDVSAPEANYEWSDGFEGGRRTLSVSGEYKVTTTNKCGTYTDSVTLDFLPFACDIFVPNAFTPNGDKLNDVFQATGNIVIQSMIIYNKWGELLYESYADTFGWDGMQNGIPAKSDTYFYVIRYEKPVENVVETLTASGGVFLMR